MFVLGDEELARIKEVRSHNDKILRQVAKQVGVEFDLVNLEFDEVTVDVDVPDKIEIVDKPSGEDQHNLPGEVFASEWVDQCQTGEDSFEGEIYLQFSEQKWLRIPFYM